MFGVANVPFVQFSVYGIDHVPYPQQIERVLLSGHNSDARGCYGAAIQQAFRQHPGAPGIVVIEHDVAASQGHLLLMMSHIKLFPDCVWTIPYLIYPESTGKQEPVWSVYNRKGPECLYYYTRFDTLPDVADFFGLGLTYLPASLMVQEVPFDGSFDYPCTDTAFSVRAQVLGVKARLCPASCAPVHLHYGLPIGYNEVVSKCSYKEKPCS